MVAFVGHPKHRRRYLPVWLMRRLNGEAVPRPMMQTVLSFGNMFRCRPGGCRPGPGLCGGIRPAGVVANTVGDLVRQRQVGWFGRNVASWRLGVALLTALGLLRPRDLPHPGWSSFADWQFWLAAGSFMNVGLSARAVADPLVYQASLRLSPVLFRLLLGH